MTSVDEQFKRAQALLAEKKPKLDSKKKLELYGYFKQATIGPNTAPQPKKSDLVASYKWHAWKKMGDTSKDDAKKKFIEFTKNVIPESKL